MFAFRWTKSHRKAKKKNTTTQLYVTSTSYRLLTGANRTAACRFQFRQSATKWLVETLRPKRSFFYILLTSKGVNKAFSPPSGHSWELFNPAGCKESHFYSLPFGQAEHVKTCNPCHIKLGHPVLYPYCSFPPSVDCFASNMLTLKNQDWRGRKYHHCPN